MERMNAHLRFDPRIVQGKDDLTIALCPGGSQILHYESVRGDAGRRAGCHKRRSQNSLTTVRNALDT